MDLEDALDHRVCPEVLDQAGDYRGVGAKRATAKIGQGRLRQDHTQVRDTANYFNIRKA